MPPPPYYPPAPQYSVAGNTAGATSAGAGSLVVAGGPNITISGATAPGAMTLSVSGAAGGAAISAATTVSRVESANVLGADDSRYAREGHQHAGIYEVSVGGNTSGVVTAGAGSIFLAGGPNITLSGATAPGGMSISASAGPDGGSVVELGLYYNLGIADTVNSQPVDARLHVTPFSERDMIFPGNMTVETMFFNLTGNVSTLAFSRSFSVGFYTLVNSTQLSLAFSASTSWGSATNLSLADFFNGARWLTLQSSQFDSPPAFSRDSYWLGYHMRSSSGLQTFSIYGARTIANTVSRSGFVGEASVSNTSQGWLPFNGFYSATFSTAMPSSLAASDINKQTSGNQFLPLVIFNNVGSDIV